MDHVQAMNTMASERYLLEEMTDTEREAFEEHFFSCGECAGDLRAGSLMIDGVRAGTGAQARTAASVPAGRVLGMPLARGAWRPSVVLPWAVAATLALVASYQSISVQPGVGPQGPLALAPTTLRPASRGQEAVVFGGQGGMITLAVDLGDIRGDAGIRYELRDAGGKVVASGDAPARPAGGPLLLLVPSTLLRAGDHYVLGVHGSGNADLTREEYRFTVEDPQKR